MNPPYTIHTYTLIRLNTYLFILRIQKVPLRDFYSEAPPGGAKLNDVQVVISYRFFRPRATAAIMGVFRGGFYVQSTPNESVSVIKT